SSAMSLPKSAGDPTSGVLPRSASRALILGSARPALISLLSFSTISAGVTLGAPTPNKLLASYPGKNSPHARDVRQGLRARLSRHRERAQPTSPDIFDW